MGKASRTKQDSSRRERIAAQRAAQRRAETRNRVLLASGAVVVVIAVVVALVLVKTTAKSKPPSKISGSPLTSGGKPEMFYLGAEYCPYCGFERWGRVVPLSRFGTFSGLHTVHSSSSDVFPNTATWTFYKSSYTSKYLTFTPVEETTNVADKSAPLGYVPLQSPTSAEQALISHYNPSGAAFPWVDFGNKYQISGSSVTPQVLQGKSWSQIAAALKDSSSPIAKAVDGTANYITAAICKLTGNQPASACTPVVKQLEAKI